MNTVLEGLTIHANAPDTVGWTEGIVLHALTSEPYALLLMPDGQVDLCSLANTHFDADDLSCLRERLPTPAGDASDWQPAVVELMGKRIVAGESRWHRGLLQVRRNADSPMQEIGKHAIHTHHTGIPAVDVQRLNLMEGHRDAEDVQVCLYPEPVTTPPGLGMEVELKHCLGHWLVRTVTQTGITVIPRPDCPHAGTVAARHFPADQWTERVHTLHKTRPPAALGMLVELDNGAECVVVGRQPHDEIVLDTGETLDGWSWREGTYSKVKRVLSLPTDWPDVPDLPEVSEEEVEKLQADHRVFLAEQARTAGGVA